MSNNQTDQPQETLTPWKIAKGIKRRVGAVYRKMERQLSIFDVPLDRLLMGGENMMRSAKFAELTGDFLRPSRPMSQSPHVLLLTEYDRIGNQILEREHFEKTEYFKNAMNCFNIAGRFVFDRKDAVYDVAKHFIGWYESVRKDKSLLKGFQPIEIRPIRYSSYYELVDGKHRVAIALMLKVPAIRGIVINPEPVLTPLQQLLMDVDWTREKRNLYQPVESPELADQWVLMRKCSDRFSFMSDFLKQQNLLPNSPGDSSYLDIGSCYSWFVHQFSKIGYDAYGVERDILAIEVGTRAYGVDPKRIVVDNLVDYFKATDKTFDVVSCLSVIHHFARGKSMTSPEDLLRMLDAKAKKVFFFDMGQAHEPAFGNVLEKWTPDYIEDWVKKNSSFKKVFRIGKDRDGRPPFEKYYNRTLFACMR